MNCPRQDNEAVMLVQKAHQVTVVRRNGYDCCSYCGSLLSDEFMRLIESGAQLGPTDKSYKVYVEVPNHDEGKLRVMGSSNAKECPGERWIKVTKEHIEMFPGNLLREGDWALIEPDFPTTTLKFYFQHLTVDQRVKFVDLLNEQKLKIGYPGHFYTLPFFCTPVK